MMSPAAAAALTPEAARANAAAAAASATVVSAQAAAAAAFQHLRFDEVPEAVEALRSALAQLTGHFGSTGHSSPAL